MRVFLKACLAGVVLATATPAAARERASDYPVRTELHPFESLTISDTQFLTGSGEGAKPVTLAGALTLPSAGTDQLPAIVLMHGSGGMGGNIAFWQRALNARGYAVFALDGFTGRGLTVVNTNQALLGRTNLILDIYRALGVLAKHPRIDPLRIAVMGFSRGGQAALYSSLQRFDVAWNRSGIRPAAYLPFYPDCSVGFRDDTDVVERPIRVVAGGADDYNPAAPCKAFVDRLRAARRDADITVYPAGQHVFDNPVGPTSPTTIAGAQTVRNCRIREEADGRLVNAETGAAFSYADPCVEKDPHIGSDAGIRDAALQSTLETLAHVFERH